jgi:hypothetical protein
VSGFIVKPSEYVQKLKDKILNKFITNKLHLYVDREPFPNVFIIIYSYLQAGTICTYI